MKQNLFILSLALAATLALIAASFDGTVKQPQLQVTTNIVVIGNSSQSNRLGGAMTIVSNYLGIGTQTNLLYKTNGFVAYTNNAAGVDASGFQSINGSGAVGVFGTKGNSARIEVEGAASAIDLADTTGKVLRWWNNSLVPIYASAELGHNGGGQYPWGNFKMQGTLYNYGFNPDASDAANYSRLAISHTGTSGFVILDSQSAGTAGSPRSFLFRTNGVNLAEFLFDASGNAMLYLFDTFGNSNYVRSVGSTAEIGGVNSVDLKDLTTSKSIRFGNYTFSPISVSHSLGAYGGGWMPWTNFIMTGTEYIYGFSSPWNNPATDYARLAISHSGAGGYVYYDAQTLGTGGNPAVHTFRGNGTNIAKIYQTAGSSFLELNSTNTNYFKISTSPTQGNVSANGALTISSYGATAGSLTVGPGYYYVQPNNASTTNFNTSVANHLYFLNNASASNGTQQWSPSFGWHGSGWSESGVCSTNVGIYAMLDPIQITAADPMGMLRFYSYFGTSVTTNNLFCISTEGPVKVASVTKAQKTALKHLEDGMIVYQTDNTPGLRAYIGGSWVIISTAADP